jgi:hypothetical protein
MSGLRHLTDLDLPMAGRAALQLALALLYDIVTLVCNSTNFSLLMNATSDFLSLLMLPIGPVFFMIAAVVH